MSINIPPRYLAKFGIEIILLSATIFIYYTSKEWFHQFEWLGTIMLVIMRFLIFLFGASVIVRLLAMIYRGRKSLAYNKKDNVTIGLSNLFLLVLTVYGAISVFGLFGVSFSAMFATLSIVAAALAILSKDFIADIISGVVISFSKEINIEDHVKIGDQKGKIIDINIAKTTLLNEDDDIIYLPNSAVFSSNVINYTKKQLKKTSIEFEAPIGTFSTVEDLEAKLIQSLSEYHSHIEPQSYYLRVTSIHKDYVAFKFQYILKQFNRQMEREIKRKAVRQIIRQTHQHPPKSGSRS